MKEQIQNLIEDKQIYWRLDDNQECTICGWKEEDFETHMCSIVNKVLNDLDNDISKLYE